MASPERSVNSPRFVRGVSARVETMEKMIPPYNEISLWLIVNVVFFLYIGLFQLVNGNGPILYVAYGSYLSAGAVVLGIVYLLLWMLRRTNKKLADRWIMLLSGLAVLGDLVFVAGPAFGSFSGDSAILDIVGLLLFRSTYQDYRSPA